MKPVELLHVWLRDERRVGRLARVDRRILFEFDAGFLADPLPLSPMRLPVRPGVHEDSKRTFDGLFGVFDDSLPDAWGRLLLDREMDRRGVGRRSLGPLDRLAAVGADGPGALTYRPAWTAEVPSVVELRTLAEEARQVLEGDAEAVFPALLALGGSSGGARPKVSVGLRPEDGAIAVGRLRDGFVPAIVKFRSPGEPADVGALEHLWLRLAARAGVQTCRSWLVGDAPGWFATERFDRLPRVHVHTAAGLLHADHRVPSLDYEALLKTGRWLTRDQRVVDELFRRACFNVLAHNRDDHSRNVAFRMSDDGIWGLTPAYDLTLSTGPGGEHWMTVVGEGRAPGPSHLLELGRRAGVVGAARILDEVTTALREWRTLAAGLDLSAASLRAVAAVLPR